LWAGLVVGYIVLACGLFLVGGWLVAQRLSYGPLLVQSVFLLWGAVWLYGGFWRRRAAYRLKYDALAYRHLFFRFLLPGVIGGLAAFIFPVLVGGEQLLPPAMAYALITYLLASMIRIEVRGKEAFWNIDLRACVYNVFPEKGQLITSGIFNWLRHPIYSTFMRWTFGLALLRNNVSALLCAGLLAAGLWVCARVEESDLLKWHADYADYRRRVPAFFIVHPAQIMRFWRFLVTGRQ